MAHSLGAEMDAWWGSWVVRQAVADFLMNDLVAGQDTD
jgi:hypothetical protein